MTPPASPRDAIPAVTRPGQSPWIAAGALLATTLFLLLGVGSLFRQQRQADNWVDHTFQVLLASNAAREDLIMVTAEGRGYPLAPGVESFARSKASLDRPLLDLARLRALTIDNPVQQRRLDLLDALVARHLEALGALLDRTMAGDAAGVATLLRLHRGQDVMDGVLVGLNAFDAEERRLLGARSRRHRQVVAAVEFALASSVIASMILIGALVRQAGRRRHEALSRTLSEREAMHRAEMTQAGFAAADAIARRHLALIETQLSVDRAAGDLDAVMRAVAEGALKAVPDADGAVVEMCDGDHMVYRATAGSSAPHFGLRLRAEGSFSGLCVREGHPLLCLDSESDGRTDREACLRVGLRSMLAVPVPHHGKRVGVLKVHAARPGALGREHVPIVQLLVGALAAGLSGVAEAEAVHALRELNKALEEQVQDRTAALRQSEEQHRLLTEHASDMVSRVDRHGCRVYVSPASRRIFDVEPQVLLGHGLLDRVVPGDRPAIGAMAASLLSGERQEARMEFRVLRPDDRAVWIEVVARSVRNPLTDAPDGYISIYRDTTERRLAQIRQDEQRRALEVSNGELERLARHLGRARDAAEKASRAKSSFLAGVSHELRTPLNGILGYARLLETEGGLSDRQAKRVGSMLTAGRHLLEMVNHVLDLSDVESERATPRVADIDVAEVARTCLDFVRPSAEEKALAIDFEIAPDTPCPIRTDPTRLRQVLLNLLGNAVKFTPAGSITLRIGRSGHCLEPSRPAVCLEVADTGPGIPQERHGQLFQDFERLGAETTMVEGSGLGLALSSRIAALLGGRIDYSDRPGGGSSFRLVLPLTIDGEARTEVSAESAATAGPLRILVVDDVMMNRDVASAFLRAAGHEVIEAESGPDAIDKSGTDRFDVILMDVRMPGMDGLEATRRIRARGGRSARTPIIALTAQAFADQIAACRDAGMDGHLIKPFAPDALVAAVAAVAAAARSSRDAETETDLPPVPDEAGCDGGPILDMAVLNRMVDLLQPAELTRHLSTIAERGRTLLAALDGTARLDAADFSARAHELAGSAGLFGLVRLSDVAHRLQHSPGHEAGGDADSAPNSCRVIARSIAAIVQAQSRLQARHDDLLRPEAADRRMAS